MDVPGLPPESQLALARLDDRLRRALRLFRKLTGHVAVAQISPTSSSPGDLHGWLPPIHPACAAKLPAIGTPPCGEQFAAHVRTGRRSRRPHRHVCPVGMQCGCIPVHFGDELVGFAKLVVGSDVPLRDFDEAVRILDIVVAESCQEFADRFPLGRPDPAVPPPTELVPNEPGAALVARAVAHLQRHYHDPALSLDSIARSLRCNPRYLTTCFTRVVGRHMHRHLLALRIAHACRLLLDSELSVKEIAFASGFADSGSMAGVFRRLLGVSPSKYRRVFSRAGYESSATEFFLNVTNS